MREAVGDFLASSRNVNQIMKTLDLHYENKSLVAKKLGEDVKNMPLLTSGKINLIQFASKTMSTVTYLQSMDLPKQPKCGIIQYCRGKKNRKCG